MSFSGGHGDDFAGQVAGSVKGILHFIRRVKRKNVKLTIRIRIAANRMMEAYLCLATVFNNLFCL